MQNKPEESQLDSRLKILDVVFKGITALVLVVGVVFGFFQFQDVKRQEAFQRQKELNTILYKNQLDLYITVTDVTARFSQATTREEAEKASKEFWELYYGKLSIVESEDVKQLMITFGKGIKDWDKRTQPPNDFIKPSDYTFLNETFSDWSYDLTQKCRAHLNSAFDSQLPVLSPGK